MNPKFEPVKRGGYNMEQVDKYINHLRTAYNEVVATNEELLERVTTLESEREDVANAMISAHTYERNRKQVLDEQVQEVITQANTKSEKIVIDARKTAQNTINFANARAKEMDEQAERTRREIVEVQQKIESILAMVHEGGAAGSGTSNNEPQTTEIQDQDSRTTRRRISDENGYETIFALSRAESKANTH